MHVRNLYNSKYNYHGIFFKNSCQPFERRLNLNVCGSHRRPICISTMLIMRLFPLWDCMDCEWKNCSMACQGQFTNGCPCKSIILGTNAFVDITCLFWFTRVNNDLHVFDCSPWLHICYMTQGMIWISQLINQFILINGIYPKWNIFWVNHRWHTQGNKKFNIFLRHKKILT